MGVIEKLKTALGDRVVTDAEVLASRRHDYWVASYVRDHVGQPGPSPLCVVRPKSVADVQALLKFANESRTAVIPFGLEAGPEGVVEHWLGHRNTVPSWDLFLQRGIVLDTVEVSADWTKIGAVYDDATQSLAQVEGVLAGSAHSSHVYRSGLNLYFTFAVMVGDPARMEATYHDGWRRIMEATDRHGGSLAHHHGIGRVRRDYLTAELGEAGVSLLRQVKATLDPNGIMNPGVLLPDA